MESELLRAVHSRTPRAFLSRGHSRTTQLARELGQQLAGRAHQHVLRQRDLALCARPRLSQQSLHRASRTFARGRGTPRQSQSTLPLPQQPHLLHLQLAHVLRSQVSLDGQRCLSQSIQKETTLSNSCWYSTSKACLIRFSIS